MIALHDDPQTLLKVDMIGNKLDDKPGTTGPMQHGHFRTNLEPAVKAAEFLEGTRTWEATGDSRAWITNVRHDDKTSVPFDEPTLGIVGMWRLGGGAHPYFAVALGETMLRVNQPFLAWNAFERAARMAGSVWPDPDLQRRFREHCEARQAMIEQELTPEVAARLRPAFSAELAFGEAFQSEYQRYEAEQIVAGKPIDDANFYDAFWSGRPPIATPVGRADWFTSDRELRAWPNVLAILFAGLFMFSRHSALRMNSLTGEASVMECGT